MYVQNGDAQKLFFASPDEVSSILAQVKVKSEVSYDLLMRIPSSAK